MRTSWRVINLVFREYSGYEVNLWYTCCTSNVHNTEPSQVKRHNNFLALSLNLLLDFHQGIPDRIICSVSKYIVALAA